MASSYESDKAVTLSGEQILALHRKLRDMRHDVNGRLANIVAAAELIRVRPATVEERLKLLLEQPPQAFEAIEIFCREFETVLGLPKR